MKRKNGYAILKSIGKFLKDGLQMEQSVILIPALNPDDKLRLYVQELMQEGFSHIIIINDGSKEECNSIFEALQDMGCIVIKHAINYGKGRALKNGFNLFLNQYEQNPDIKGIITVDSDGQHLVKDVLRMDEIIKNTSPDEDLLLLGTRNFDGTHVPLKSSFGNKMTSFLFALLYGKKIHDTQTGLRGFTPPHVLRKFLTLKGERFEYETSMLIQAVRKKIRIEELPIETVYVNNNSETHFRPLQDSVIIYRILFGEFFRYLFSALSASAIDLLLFYLLAKQMPGTIGIWIATACARLVSSFYNYSVNRKVVFESQGNMKQTIWRYYGLCIIQAICSAALVSGFFLLLPLPKTLCKAIVDTVLFFISYQIQRCFVFSEKSA